MFTPSVKLSLFVLASIGLAAIPSTGAAAEHLKQAGLATLPETSQHAFARPQQLIDIGGRRLNLYCSGSGPVTVVFDAYSTGAGSSWHAVQPHIARRTRACVYDRAGLGFSDPAPGPVTSASAVDDLGKLMRAAGIAPPYVLVGSSYGGANAQLYALRHPEQLKGMVLVEPMHEDEEDRLLKVTEGKLKMMREVEAHIRAACTAESVKGFSPGSELWGPCIGPVPEGRGRVLGASELARRLSPAYWKANNAEVAGFEASSAQLRAARKPFGNLPLIVLSRSISPYATPGQPQSPLNKAMEEENQRLMQEVAAMSTRGTLRRIPDAGHVVHETKPEAVVKAIEDMLEIVR